MCQQVITPLRMLCRHTIENPGIRVACPEDCGEWTIVWSMGMTTKPYPCDDCIAAGKWAKTRDGNWRYVTEEPESEHDT